MRQRIKWIHRQVLRELGHNILVSKVIYWAMSRAVLLGDTKEPSSIHAQKRAVNYIYFAAALIDNYRTEWQQAHPRKFKKLLRDLLIAACFSTRWNGDETANPNYGEPQAILKRKWWAFNYRGNTLQFAFKLNTQFRFGIPKSTIRHDCIVIAGGGKRFERKEKQSSIKYLFAAKLIYEHASKK